MLTMCFEANLALVTHALYLLDCVLRLKTEKNNNEAKIITRVPQEARVRRTKGFHNAFLSFPVIFDMVHEIQREFKLLVSPEWLETDYVMLCMCRCQAVYSRVGYVNQINRLGLEYRI